MIAASRSRKRARVSGNDRLSAELLTPPHIELPQHGITPLSPPDYPPSDANLAEALVYKHLVYQLYSKNPNVLHPLQILALEEFVDNLKLARAQSSRRQGHAQVTTLDDIKSMIETLQSTVEDKTSDLANAIDDLDGEIKEVADQVGDVKCEVDEISGNIDEFSTSIDNLESEMETVKSEVADSCENIQTTMKDFRKQIYCSIQYKPRLHV